MFEDYHDGKTRSQLSAFYRAKEISVSVYGKKWNQGHYPLNCKAYDSKGAPEKTYVYDIFKLYELLVLCNGPFYARYYNDDLKQGHLVVLTGVDLYYGKVYTNNPWGIAGEQTFEEFKQGFVGEPGGFEFWYCYLV